MIVTQFETVRDWKPSHPILPEWLYRAREAAEAAWKAVDKLIDLDYHYATWDVDYKQLLNKALRADLIAVSLGSVFHSNESCTCNGAGTCYMCKLIGAIDG
jgi:hypothetical protein